MEYLASVADGIRAVALWSGFFIMPLVLFSVLSVMVDFDRSQPNTLVFKITSGFTIVCVLILMFFPPSSYFLQQIQQQECVKGE